MSIEMSSPIPDAPNLSFLMGDEVKNFFVKRVFSNQLLLEKIFSVWDSDLKTLLNMRLVCKAWKDGVYSTLLNNLSLLPTISAYIPRTLDEKDLLRRTRTPEGFFATFKPGSGIPLKLYMDPSVRPAVVVNLLNGYADEVVYLSYYHDFSLFEGETNLVNENNSLFEFPALKHAKLSCMSLRSDTSAKFVKLLELYNQVLGSTPNLKELEVVVGFNKENGLPFNDPSLDLLPFSQITCLESCAAFLDKLVDTRVLPKLKKVKLGRDSVGQTVVKSNLLLTGGGNLTNLVIQPYTNVEIGYLKQLKALHICRDSNIICGLEKPVPIPQLLPNLTKLRIDSDTHGAPGSALTTYTGGGHVFEKLTHLILNEKSDTEKCYSPNSGYQRHVNFAPVSACLHRLKSLQWVTERSILEFIPVAHSVFSNFQHLTALLLCCSIDYMYKTFTKDGIPLSYPCPTTETAPPLPEIFRLLTGMYPDEIPADPAMWSMSLQGRPTAICNLKSLRALQLYTKLGCRFGFTFNEHESRFLFHAAFKQMDSLKVIKVNSAFVFHDDCIVQWTKSGRTFVGDCIPKF